MNLRHSFSPLALLGAALLMALPATVSAQGGGKGMSVAATNNAFLDAHVYAVQDGNVRSLGMVTGLTTSKLTLPSSMVDFGQDIRLLIDPIGSATSYLTEPIMVVPGERVALTIEQDPALSSITVSSAHPGAT